MISFFADDPVLLVFAVMGVAAALGALPVRGVTLGPAAALFVGLGVGAIDERLSGVGGLGVLRELGLVLFTYTVGLASGPTFFLGLRRGGLRVVTVTVGLVLALAGLCAAAAALLGLSGADRAGLFAGAATNTPALQAAAESTTSGDPVVAYSLAYPSAVLSMLVVLTLLLGRRLKLPARLEPPPPPEPAEPLVNWTVEVTVASVPPLSDLVDRFPGVAFSRIEHGGTVSVAIGDHRPAVGDCVVVLGPETSVVACCEAIGRRSDRHLPLDRSVLDFRRIVVSNRRLAGTTLADADLTRRFGVTVTRVRRGDDDLVAHDGLVLQLGDRVRVVGPTAQLARVARVLGDSERRLAEVDAAGFALGIAAGLALGAVSVPLPGGADLKLGAGGGPLVVGLVLGLACRTGPVTWQIPQGANLVFRQFGILMFLACAGLGSGTLFADAIVTRRGLELAGAGLVVAAAFAALIPFVTEVAARRDLVQSAGLLAGIETQPAALGYASERTGGDERVTAAYALVFPAAMIAKIVVVQFLA